MKNLYLITLLLFLSFSSYSQFGVSYHQSNIPFAGVNYQFSERIISELRIGVDHYLEDMGVELMGGYIFSENEIIQAYAGLGLRVNLLMGVVLPVGLNIYPFDSKNFGFHAELAPIISGEEPGLTILRGSWGIRYRFSR